MHGGTVGVGIETNPNAFKFRTTFHFIMFSTLLFCQRLFEKKLPSTLGPKICFSNRNMQHQEHQYYFWKASGWSNLFLIVSEDCFDSWAGVELRGRFVEWWRHKGKLQVSDYIHLMYSGTGLRRKILFCSALKETKHSVVISG